MKFLFLSFLSLLFLNQTLFAKPQVYKCLDQYGRPTYSTQATCSEPIHMYLKKHKQKSEAKESNPVANNKAKQCLQAKQNLIKYTKASRLTKTVTVNGKVQKLQLTKQEKEKAIYDAQKDVDYWCK